MTIIGDTAVSLAAGLAIISFVFAKGVDPASGPGLMFVTLPLAFARLPENLAHLALSIIAKIRPLSGGNALVSELGNLLVRYRGDRVE